SQAKLAQNLKKLGEGRGRLIFGAQYPAVREGSELLNRIAPLGGKEGGGMGKMHQLRFAGELAAAAGSIAALSFGHGIAAATTLGGTMGAIRIITGALTNPATSSAALKILRVAAATSARAVPYGVDAVINQPSNQDSNTP
ncbi:MAG TPA: hypothetical protein VGF36_12735, partial [Rhodopila sp.]